MWVEVWVALGIHVPVAGLCWPEASTCRERLPTAACTHSGPQMVERLDGCEETVIHESQCSELLESACCACVQGFLMCSQKFEQGNVHV